jgi:hypothetical protein
MLTDIEFHVMNERGQNTEHKDFRKSPSDTCQLDFGLSYARKSIPMINIYLPPTLAGGEIFLTEGDAIEMMKQLASVIDACKNQYPSGRDAEYMMHGECPPPRKSLIDCFTAIDSLGQWADGENAEKYVEYAENQDSRGC